jgi:hypothetical protein
LIVHQLGTWRRLEPVLGEPDARQHGDVVDDADV